MNQHNTPRIPAGLSPGHSPPLMRLLLTHGHRSLPWVGACLGLARQAWPQVLRGHAKCNTGSGQHLWAEMGAAGAAALTTGAEGKRRERYKKDREGHEGEKGRKEWETREREGGGGRPVGDPTPQRGKVVAYTQASKPRVQASTHARIKITQTENRKNSH